MPRFGWAKKAPPFLPSPAVIENVASQGIAKGQKPSGRQLYITLTVAIGADDRRHPANLKVVAPSTKPLTVCPGNHK